MYIIVVKPGIRYKRDDDKVKFLGYAPLPRLKYKVLPLFWLTLSSTSLACVILSGPKVNVSHYSYE